MSKLIEKLFAMEIRTIYDFSEATAICRIICVKMAVSVVICSVDFLFTLFSVLN